MDNNSHLLIVDDHEEARAIVKSALKSEGYLLNFADSGPSALALAREIIPDLILLDVMMPGMNGFEVCQRLRQDPVLAEIPVILLTALNDRRSRLAGIEAGADDFLSKPFDRIELRARLRTITKLNRYRRLLAERSKFEWVVEQADEGYAVLDDEGHITYLNACARRYLNLPEQNEKHAGKEFLALTAKQYQYQPENAWEDWPAAGDPSVSRLLVRPETWTRRAFWLQVDTLQFPAGAARGFLVRLRDVSEKMKLQWLSCTFEGMIAHKLSTPLNGLGILDSLKRRLTGKISGNDMEFLDIAIQNAARLSRQIQDILEHKSTFGVVKNETGFTVSGLEELFMAVARDLEITASVQTLKSDARLLLSEDNLQAIFSHLLTNSKKFHPQHTPATKLTVLPKGANMIAMRIGDDGVHVPPEELSKVWRPYYQSEKHFTGEVEGMGLGLGRVAAIVWSVGGCCRMFNQADKPGVVVELSLPLQEDYPTNNDASALWK
ncbi:MAG: response regulator [Gammaproteobacteria bacterium]|nr:response regulator [Gammaproteobacteria bacterium]